MSRCESPANQFAAAAAVAGIGFVLIQTIFDRVLPTPATYALAVHPAKAVVACTDRSTTRAPDLMKARVQSQSTEQSGLGRGDCVQRSTHALKRAPAS
jgi:hypothetical protein